MLIPIDKNWVATPPTSAHYFKLKFLPPFRAYKLLITQYQAGSPPEIFDTRLIYPATESQIFNFEPPPIFPVRRIGIRGIAGQRAFCQIYQSTYMPISNPSAPNYPVSTAAASTTVASSVTSVPILAANPARKGATVWNASTATLYLDLDATATTADYAAKLDPSGYYEVPYGFTGALSGIWSAANGNALVREFT